MERATKSKVRKIMIKKWQDLKILNNVLKLKKKYDLRPFVSSFLCTLTCFGQVVFWGVACRALGGSKQQFGRTTHVVMFTEAANKYTHLMCLVSRLWLLAHKLPQI